LRLGHLVAEGLDTNDLLGRWIAHHLADLMLQATAARGSEKQRLSAECSNLILRLWKHKADVPFLREPLVSLEAVARGLAYLDPERSPWPRLEPITIASQVDPDQAESDARIVQLVTTAHDLDKTLRQITRALLSEAADVAGKQEQTWLSIPLIPEDETNDVMGLLEKLSGGNSSSGTLEATMRNLLSAENSLNLASQLLANQPEASPTKTE
jgi:hypothetical protein